MRQFLKVNFYYINMEENNDYYIDHENLDFILKKINFIFNIQEKETIIKIINSTSINNGLETSGFPNQKKIIVLRIYLEWKNYILQKKFDTNNLKKEIYSISNMSDKSNKKYIESDIPKKKIQDNEKQNQIENHNHQILNNLQILKIRLEIIEILKYDNQNLYQ